MVRMSTGDRILLIAGLVVGGLAVVVLVGSIAIQTRLMRTDSFNWLEGPTPAQK